MWNNNNQSGYTPPAFPSGPGFPSAQQGGYNLGYAPYGAPPGPPSGYPPPQGPPSYASPPGPPLQGSYPPPSGPPSVQRGSYPGQQYHQQAGGGYPGQHSPPAPNYGGNQQYYPPPGGVPPRPPAQQQFYGPRVQGPNHQTMQPSFQYSQCTGKRKALSIGINYFGQNGELRGCINDANNVSDFLCQHYGYKKEDIVKLTDDATNPRQQPTRQNIIDAMQWLVRGAAPNDSLFFHYSGHGGQTKDTDGDEADGYDEVIYPLDFEDNGHIVDDLMYTIMVKPLPAGCRLTAIFDSCHSGSALDLPYIYSTEGKLKEPNLTTMAGQGILSAATSYARGDMGGLFQSAMGIARIATGSASKADKLSKATRTSPADVISWSGCKDSQTSADTEEAGQATGAMSYAFMTVLAQNKQQSYQQLLVNIRGILKAKYSQKPQLSSSHPMDTNYLFIC